MYKHIRGREFYSGRMKLGEVRVICKLSVQCRFVSEEKSPIPDGKIHKTVETALNCDFKKPKYKSPIGT